MRYLFVLLLVAGCSATFTHPTKSEADFQADVYECEKEAASVQEGAIYQRMLERCLGLKGWRR
jgi:hypothetical protein